MLGILTPLASLLGLEAGAIREKLQRQIMFWGALGALGLVCVNFLLVAADMALASVYGPIIAPLIIAGVALIAALIVWFIFDMREKSERRRLAEEARQNQSANLATSAAIAALPMFLKSPLLRQFGIPAAGAIAAGFLLSRFTFPHHDGEP